jgi:hypothetical protein
VSEEENETISQKVVALVIIVIVVALASVALTLEVNGLNEFQTCMREDTKAVVQVDGKITCAFVKVVQR